MTPWHRWEGDDLLLTVRVQPNASQDTLAGIHGDTLKVRITAPATAGKANSHLLGYLAQLFGVPKNAIILLSGNSARTKRLSVHKPRQLPEIFDPT